MRSLTDLIKKYETFEEEYHVHPLDNYRKILTDIHNNNYSFNLEKGEFLHNLKDLLYFNISESRIIKSFKIFMEKFNI
jgi:hypothetical protein